MTLPDGLTIFRLGAAPVLIPLAAAGQDRLFLLLLATALATDALDGPLARATRQVSERGARLDSLADLSVYTLAPLGVGLLHPWLFREHPWLVLSIVGAWALPIAIGAVRFRRITSYHTRVAKLAGGALALAGLAFLVSHALWPLRVACALLWVSALEEIAITCILREWRTDVPSVWAARRLSENMTSRARGFVTADDAHMTSQRQRND